MALPVWRILHHAVAHRPTRIAFGWLQLGPFLNLDSHQRIPLFPPYRCCLDQ